MVATARKWRFSPPGTGEIIRDYLKGKGVGYPYDAWRYYKMCLRKIYPELIEVPGDKKTKKAEVIYHTADYSSFYRYFYILEELGLIERVKSEYGRAKIPRVYFKIVPEMKDSEAWYKPQVILYPQTGVGRKEWREIMRIAGEKGVSTRDIFAQDYRGEIEDSAEIMDVGADVAVATFSALGRLVPHVRPPKLKPEVEELKEKLRTCEIKLEACETDLERVTAEFEELKVPPPPPRVRGEEIDKIIDTYERVIEREEIQPLEGIEYEAMIVAGEWDIILDEDKKKLCTKLLEIPAFLTDNAIMRYDFFKELFDNCTKYILER